MFISWVGAVALASAAAASGAGDSVAWGRRAVVLVSPDFRLPERRIEFGADETERCLGCHGLPNFVVRDSLTGTIRHLGVVDSTFRRSAHGKLACTQCHGDIRVHPHEFQGARSPVGCDADCHARDPEGRPIRHQAQVAEFREGAHRKGLTADKGDNPDCVTCHGQGDPHAAGRVKDALGPREKMALCGPCHDDRERMARSRVSPEAVASYRRSFHYKAIRFGSTRAAVCQDCHTPHRVIAPRDTASTVSVAHLPRTCGQEDCHPGARMNFAMSGANHLGLRVRRQPALAAVETFFVVLSVVTLAALGAGVFFDAQRRLAWPATARRGLRRMGFHPGRKRTEVAQASNPGASGVAVPDRIARFPATVPSGITTPRSNPGRLIQRMSFAQRLQHGALVVSFVALAVTGIPLRFPDVEPIAAFYRALGDLEVARPVHRGAATLMALVMVAHVIYALTLLAKARFDARRAWPMLPAWKDARDWWETSMYYLGRRAAPPATDRREFREKLHYFAVLWGVPVMTFSGCVLGFPVFFGNRLPDLALGMAQIAHSDEALLAVAVVAVWHLYNVHVSPGAHHRFMTWIDGKITREQWMIQHPLEVERSTGEAVPLEWRTRMFEESLRGRSR